MVKNKTPEPAPPIRKPAPPPGPVFPPEPLPELMPDIPQVRNPEARWLARTHELPGGEVVRYQIHPPLFLRPGERYPVVIVLHGANGRGTDNRKQIEPPYRLATHFWLTEAWQREHPCFVIAPQAPPSKATTWVRQWGLPPATSGQPLEPLEAVLALVDELSDELLIDRARQYIVGQSMGAFGVWLAVTRHPLRFAAALAMAGGGAPAMVTPEIVTGVWAFHGAKDNVVPVRRSREMAEAFRRAGVPIRYTEYPSARHDAWTRAFSEAGLAEWVFSHRIGGAPPTAESLDGGGELETQPEQ